MCIKCKKLTDLLTICISKLKKRQSRVTSLLKTTEGSGDIKSQRRGYFSYKEQTSLKEKYIEITNISKSLCNRISKIEVIGRGAFGTVYRGKDKELNRIIAIKEIYSSGKIPESDIMKELNILSKLSHRNIVEFFGSKYLDGSMQIYMEYINGGSLKNLIKAKGKLTETEIKKVLTDVLEGLEYLHHMKIVHRDIKGANVLISKDGTCKLADFGCSSLISGDISGFESVVGTCNWMAPEVIQQKGYGRFADIWSIGCLIIEMATGRPPWAYLVNQFSIYMHVCKTEEVPQLPNGYSPELQDLVNRCLKRNDKERRMF